MPPFIAILGDPVNVKQPTGRLFKSLEQGSIETEVVTARGEKIVPGERCINLHFAVSIQPGLAASDDWAPRGTRGGIAADRELLDDGISEAGDVDGVEGEKVG